MKSIFTMIFAIMIAIFISTFFMKTTTEEEIPVISSSNNVYAFQIGAYKSLDDANNRIKEVGGVVYYDGVFYYVFFSYLSREENILKMQKYLNSNNIEFFIKQIEITDELMGVLNEYEKLMLSSNSEVAFLQLNERLLDEYEAVYVN